MIQCVFFCLFKELFKPLFITDESLLYFPSHPVPPSAQFFFPLNVAVPVKVSG